MNLEFKLYILTFTIFFIITTQIMSFPIENEFIFTLYWPNEFNLGKNIALHNDSIMETLGKCKSSGNELEISVSTMLILIVICFQISLILFRIDNY